MGQTCSRAALKSVSPTLVQSFSLSNPTQALSADCYSSSPLRDRRGWRLHSRMCCWDCVTMKQTQGEVWIISPPIPPTSSLPLDLYSVAGIPTFCPDEWMFISYSPKPDTDSVVCVCVYLPVSPWLICYQKRSADVTAQRRTGRVTAGRRRPGQRGNKSVIFHPVHKQVIILRWAIAYYGLHPACDITKQRRTALCEGLARANGECVLTSWHGLRGAWTSSAHGNPGRQCTCYDRVWEQTWVQHLSSCQLRHKLWIMNIAEVMGLWDSFIALTNRISLEGWGAGIRQMTYFALQQRPLNLLTLWPVCHLYPTLLEPRCCDNWASIFRCGESLCDPLSGLLWVWKNADSCIV